MHSLREMKVALILKKWKTRYSKLDHSAKVKLTQSLKSRNKACSGFTRRFLWYGNTSTIAMINAIYLHVQINQAYDFPLSFGLYKHQPRLLCSSWVHLPKWMWCWIQEGLEVLKTWNPRRSQHFSCLTTARQKISEIKLFLNSNWQNILPTKNSQTTVLDCTNGICTVCSNWTSYVCSLQFAILHNFEIALRKLKVVKLLTNFEIAQPNLRNFQIAQPSLRNFQIALRKLEIGIHTWICKHTRIT